MKLKQTSIPNKYEVYNAKGTLCGWVVKHEFISSSAVNNKPPKEASFWIANCRGMLKQKQRFDTRKAAAEYVASHAFRTSHRSETLQPKGRPSRASQKV